MTAKKCEPCAARETRGGARAPGRRRVRAAPPFRFAPRPRRIYRGPQAAQPSSSHSSALLQSTPVLAGAELWCRGQGHILDRRAVQPPSRSVRQRAAQMGSWGQGGPLVAFERLPRLEGLGRARLSRRRDVPEPQLAVARGRRERGAVRGKGDGPDGVVVAHEVGGAGGRRGRWGAGLPGPERPEEKLAVGGGGREVVAVRGEGEGADPAHVQVRELQDQVARGAPEADGLVVGAGREQHTARGEGDRVHQVRMPLQALGAGDLLRAVLSFGNVPEAGGGVGRARGQRASVGREGQRPDG